MSDLRLRSLELTRAQRGRDEGKIIELQVIQNTLEQHVKRLELENTKLHKQLTQAQQEMDSMKAVTRSSRISKAKSETDLSRKFDKYTSYGKHRYRDLEPVVKAVNFSTRGDTSGLGATQFSALDTNYTRSHNFGVSSLLSWMVTDQRDQTLREWRYHRIHLYKTGLDRDLWVEV